MALLKSGLKGEPVRRLQHKLGIPADGEFGPKTESALKAWQNYQQNQQINPDWVAAGGDVNSGLTPIQTAQYNAVPDAMWGGSLD